MTTLKDVAKLAGVSPSTVSIVVNQKYDTLKISPATQEKVRKAIRELNYQPNVAAKVLRRNQTNEYMIAVYWANDARSAVIGSILKGFQHTIESNHYPVNIVIRPYRNGTLSQETDLQTRGAFHAAIIANTATEDMKFLESFSPIIPTVLFNRYLKNYNTVTVDSHQFGDLAIKPFLKTSPGRLGLISLKNPYLAMQTRQQAVIQAFKKLNYQVEETPAISQEDTAEAGYEAMKAFPTNNLPDIVYCDSDTIAFGAIRYLQECGIPVPEKTFFLAAGTQTHETAQFLMPSLKTLEIPTQKIASTCLDILMQILQGHEKPPLHKQCLPFMM
ncbi:MAG: LacI family DNA-binding transcriptional regulator [Megasphaera sp.]|uniref:LacI family DNA-binding transcriptional regulator n=1 Tax=unclassified Megasphaera TaxID=2626256 RepID=UPI003A810E1F